MKLADLEKRLAALEQAVAGMQTKQNGTPRPEKQVHWWRDEAGRFANDPVFDEMVRLGREYRESLRPGRKKGVKKKTRKQSDAHS